MSDVKEKEVDKMVPIYYNLIVKGKRTIEQVPNIIKDDVKNWLIDNGHAELAEEDV